MLFYLCFLRFDWLTNFALLSQSGANQYQSFVCYERFPGLFCVNLLRVLIFHFDAFTSRCWEWLFDIVLMTVLPTLNPKRLYVAVFRRELLWLFVESIEQEHHKLMRGVFLFCHILQRQHFACFGSWVLYHTLNIMIQYLLSGFELELYSPHEYHYVFW